MNTNRLGNRSAVITLALATVLLVGAFSLSLLNTGAGSKKASSNVTTSDETTVRQIQQAQGEVGNISPLRSLTNPVNKNDSAGGLTKGPGGGQAQNGSTAPGSNTSKPTKTRLTALTAAENQLYTSDNRLFVTGENGIFEIVARADGSVKVIERAPKHSCSFGGIVEAFGVLYVNCSTLGPSYVYAAVLDATPSFKRIYAFKSAILPNGLTADNSGNLYVASMFAGQILRLKPSITNPLTFAKTGVWRNGTGPFTDGIKFYDDSIYWTDGQFVNRVEVKPDGTPGRQTRILAGAPTIFDDLAIDNNGILVTDHIYGVIRKYDLNGRSTGTINARFSGPSSVAWARAPFPAGSLIVTERAGNQVTLFTP